MTQAEKLAEALFKYRQHKQIEYARRVYADNAFKQTEEAYKIGVASRDDQRHAAEVCKMLENLFGEETFGI